MHQWLQKESPVIQNHLVVNYNDRSDKGSLSQFMYILTHMQYRREVSVLHVLRRLSSESYDALDAGFDRLHDTVLFITWEQFCDLS